MIVLDPATADEQGLRLDKFLAVRLADMSRTRLGALIKSGCVFLQGAGATEVLPKQNVQAGQVWCINEPPVQKSYLTPWQDCPFQILYEDDDILAVNKPHGMPTHPSLYHFDGTLANGVMHYFKDTPFTFRAPSRLDRDTSGVIIIAKNAFAAASISKQIISGDFKKEYIALCVGTVSQKIGTINAPIKREAAGIIKRQISEDGKPAVTNYEVLEEKNGFSLVKATPITGRTHQIRLHLSHIGIPIFADFLYGTDVPEERIRLHCKSIEFFHPATNNIQKITAPLPSDMLLENMDNI